MQRRIHGGARGVQIPSSATNGWSTSWKKFLIELMWLKGWVTLYPSFFNQTSFSTNHLEPGEHIGGKANTLKHRPIDFVVPLMRERAMLRELWADTDAMTEGRRRAETSATKPTKPTGPTRPTRPTGPRARTPKWAARRCGCRR